VTFAGPPERAARLVPDAGFELDAFAVSGFPRRVGPSLARALVRAARAPVACRRIIERRRADVVLGAGGYVAGPMVVAAWSKRVPSAVMEADAHLGLANRVAAPFANRVFLSFPIAARTGAKYRVTGRPIPARSRVRERGEARRVFDLPEDGELLLVFGGSQGAHALNVLAVDEFGADGPHVLHLCGEREYHELAPRVRRDTYRLLPFTDDFGAALGAADVALARAGGSLWELAAAGLPAVVVPYPHATAEHQHLNAAYFDEGVVVVDESDLERTPGEIRLLLADRERRAKMRESMLRLARPNAAEEIADELVALARR
jgi:UDP-N-acetylglucosamine--N-acetylmuramyl-(pentapeptide) pyrophosphoryl-undecaprenol N-acetylglucosamine transferase